MPDRIDAYVKDLRQALVKTMDPRQAQIVSEEVSAHLIDRYEGFLALGSDSDIAELEALRTFGTTAEIAAKFEENKPFVCPTLSPLTANLIEMATWTSIVAGYLIFKDCLSAIQQSPFNQVAIFLFAAAAFIVSCLPLFCRRLPWIGFVVGYFGYAALLHFHLNLGSGSFKFPYLLVWLNLLSWIIGILIRKIIDHLVNQHRQKPLQKF